MMALPFFTLFAALAFALKGRRDLAIASWGVSAAIILLLFRYHATDALNLNF